MKDILEKIRQMKGGPWALLLAVCALLYLFTSFSGGQGDYMTDEERRISHALSLIEGAGESRITIYYAGNDGAFGQESAPEGAVIISRGAGDLWVRLQLMQAAETLLGLSADQVEIFPMEEAK